MITINKLLFALLILFLLSLSSCSIIDFNSRNIILENAKIYQDNMISIYAAGISYNCERYFVFKFAIINKTNNELQINVSDVIGFTPNGDSIKMYNLEESLLIRKGHGSKGYDEDNNLVVDEGDENHIRSRYLKSQNIKPKIMSIFELSFPPDTGFGLHLNDGIFKFKIIGNIINNKKMDFPLLVYDANKIFELYHRKQESDNKNSK